MQPTMPQTITIIQRPARRPQIKSTPIQRPAIRVPPQGQWALGPIPWPAQRALIPLSHPQDRLGLAAEAVDRPVTPPTINYKKNSHHHHPSSSPCNQTNQHIYIYNKKWNLRISKSQSINHSFIILILIISCLSPHSLSTVEKYEA